MNPGNYEVSFEAGGFKKLVRTNITVRSTETVRVDAVLEVGQVVESIEVGAQATLLETETLSTGHLVSAVQLNKLPSPQMKVESMLWYRELLGAGRSPVSADHFEGAVLIG